MLPTLRPGDRLVVVRSFAPKVGALVALRDPEEPSRLLVKRLAERDGRRFTVIGDNPESSRDSRRFGPVDRRDLIGRAVYCYHPSDRVGMLRRRAAPPSGTPDVGRTGALPPEVAPEPR